MDNDKPVGNSGQWQEDTTHWYKDGSAVIRVESTLYKIHLSMLEKLSPDIAGILAIPDGKSSDDPTREGSINYPLHFQGVNKQEWEDFLFWLYRADWNPLADDVTKERVLANLLKLSDLFQIEVGKRYAIEHLQTMSLPPSRMLELAQKYSIHEWVLPAVKMILRRKISDFTEQDIARVGLKVYTLLVKGRECIDIEIRRTANVEPEMETDPSWKCTNHELCLKTWKRIWWNIIGRKMLHPDYPMTTAEILYEIQQLKVKGLTIQCRDDMARHIYREEITFFDARVVPAVADAIIAYHRSL